jgi:hypothetical protein
MKPTDRPITTAHRGDGSHLSRLATAASRAAHGVATFIAECNYAQRRLLQLRLNPDRYILGGGNAPDTYAEFLFRTSGWLPHEPPAARRCPTRH